MCSILISSTLLWLCVLAATEKKVPFLPRCVGSVLFIVFACMLFASFKCNSSGEEKRTKTKQKLNGNAFSAVWITSYGFGSVCVCVRVCLFVYSLNNNNIH